jgi:hypothetical protein
MEVTYSSKTSVDFKHITWCYITEDNSYNVKFQVLTAVSMKIIVFWGVMPCIVVNMYQCVGGTCFFQIKCKRGSLTEEEGLVIQGRVDKDLVYS